MSREMATWEDEEELRVKFPLAPAWGQAGGKEGENVTILPGQLSNKLQETDEELQEKAVYQPEEQAQVQAQPRRSKRGRIPSTRYAGQDWTR
jgi:hypothetical protein